MTCDKTLASANISLFDAASDGCIVDWAKKAVKKIRLAACGRSNFCRGGAQQLDLILSDIAKGSAKDGDFELLAEISGSMKAFADCDMTRDLAAAISDSLVTNADDWNQHIKRKKCSTLKCDHLVRFYIDPVLCTGCEKCLKKCEYKAISGSYGLIHIINEKKCKNCAECEGICAAVLRTDPKGVPPRVPQTPVKVGSFKGGGRSLGGGRAAAPAAAAAETKPAGRGGLGGGRAGGLRGSAPAAASEAPAQSAAPAPAAAPQTGRRGGLAAGRNIGSLRDKPADKPEESAASDRKPGEITGRGGLGSRRGGLGSR